MTIILLVWSIIKEDTEIDLWPTHIHTHAEWEWDGGGKGGESVDVCISWAILKTKQMILEFQNKAKESYKVNTRKHISGEDAVRSMATCQQWEIPVLWTHTEKDTY